MSLSSKVEGNAATAASEQNKTDKSSTKYSLFEDLDEFDFKYDICDSRTPRETYLCGRYKRSFAYYTIRYRLPNILNTLLTSLRENLKGCNYAENDVLYVLDSVANLKRQLETDGPLETIPGGEPDIDIWNEFLCQLPPDERTFFKACWLYSECYLYRSIFSIFRSSNAVKEYDYFGVQKLNGLKIASGIIDEIISNLKTTENNEETFTHILKLNLWGNRCDLSISCGQEVKPTEARIDSLNANILIDESSKIWRCLNNRDEQQKHRKVIDFICDNAGYELFTDLFLARYLVEHKLTDTVRFHVKALPWYVSDTTTDDFLCSLQYLKEHKSKNISDFGIQCKKHFQEGAFEIIPEEYFWTTPYEFYRMIDIDRPLYQLLQNSSLIIFKGDLNYRKLIGDFNWDFTESFQKCLRGFSPANLCTLRTVKGDLICGLKHGVAEQLTLKDPDWMFTGEYGVVQFAEHA